MGRGEPDRGVLEGLARTLRHRGPDDWGVHVDGPVGLVHTRLSIIDLAGGHQPILADEGALAVVANGEIYNYLELREELIGQGRQFHSGSDSETIVHAYASDPQHFLSRLHGMFAFALYDRPRGRVLLARDRLGIKPLYYLPLPDRVAFASELKALLPLLPETPKVRPTALAEYLQNQFNSGRDTVVEGIHRLLPGEALAVEADLSLRRWHYWSASEIVTASVDQGGAEEEFDALVDRVMREHMRSDVPYGLFLSGGVDSAVILAMLSRLQEQPVRTFSVGFRDSHLDDELDAATGIAKRFATRHTRIVLDPEELFQRAPHVIWATDDLMRDYACLPTAVLAERAAQELKVVFSGEGGDEVFAGYRRYGEAAALRWLKNLRHPGSGGFRTRGHMRGHWLKRLPGARLTKALGDFRAPLQAAWNETPPGWSFVQRAQYADLTRALPDNLLVKLDRITMAFGLEGRVPFLDHRLVAFGLGLPDALKLRGHTGKLFLRRWAERYLPAEHLAGRKRGFHVPMGDILSGRRFAAILEKLPRSPAIREWFQARGVAELLSAHGHSGKHAREVWMLLQFALWHRIFVEQPGSRPDPVDQPLDWLS
jgi:asparagine synthase (glutamine-hydrolysing)